jgi:hypothetical protein
MNRPVRPLLPILVLLAVQAAAGVSAQDLLFPTPSDALGPFYVPGAPVRESVGQGYLLTGRAERGSQRRSSPEYPPATQSTPAAVRPGVPRSAVRTHGALPRVDNSPDRP